jgi:hypothetical protein
MSFWERGIRDGDFGVVRTQPALGMTPALIIRTEQNAMPKADKDGVYEIETADGETTRIFVAKGDEIPEGATLKDEEGSSSSTSEKRARGAAPENRAV